MKLFLSSLTLSASQSSELARLVGKEPRAITMAYVENAADTYDESDRGWVAANHAAIESHGYDVEAIDLREYNRRPSLLKDKLRTKDVIWFGGGNTFYLRWLLKDTGVDVMLQELIPQGLVYGGDSAGAIIAGPTLKHFEAADDPNDAPEVVFSGLKLTNMVVVPHMDSVKFAPVIQKIADQLQADGFTIVPLRDAQALIIDGDKQRVIG
ncbi:MAG TPA: Type 1 glutamine amidotransferase-like domain-containing protein [Patescibacteria group bacterium]|nr:Type 1 glutamine amidotransferase-like domain-containing protein [Patescibacteria group bacterium]